MADEEKDKSASTDTFKMPMLKGVGTAPGTPMAASSASPADDTRTRRTVRLSGLRTGMQPSLNQLPVGAQVSTDSGVISDPLAGRGTDSGVISGAGATPQSGIKLKPISAPAAQAAAPQAPTIAPAAPTGGDTRTRKTVQLAALAASVKSSDAAPAPAAPAAAPAPAAGDDTRTRRTLQLSALAASLKAAPGAPSAAAPAQPVGRAEVDDTIRLQRHEAPAMPGGIGAATAPSPGISIAKTAPAASGKADSTQTQAVSKVAPAQTVAVKIPEPQAVSAPSIETNTQAIAPVNVGKSTIRIKAQAAHDAPAAPAAAPAAPAAPAEPAAEPAPAAAASAAVTLVSTPVKQSTSARKNAAKPAATKAPKKSAAKVALPKAAATPQDQPAQPKVLPIMPQSSPPSRFYAVVAAVALLAMIFCTALTVIQCINVWHPDWVNGQRIDVPLVEDWINK